MIVKSVDTNISLGVPETTPVVVLKLRPEGKFGAIAYVSILPPIFCVVIFCNNTFTTPL